MKKVALITTRFIRQAPNRQLLYLIRNIDRDKIQPVIIVLSPETKSTLIEEFNKEKIEIIQLNLSFLSSLFKAQHIIDRILTDKGINIIHSFCYAIRAEFVIFRLKNAFKIASVRNVPSKSSSGYHGFILGWLMYKLKMRMYGKFNKIAVCSESLNKLPELKPFDRVIIQDGIDISLGKDIRLIAKEEIKNQLKLPVDNKIYLTVSNGTPIKNIDFLVRVFSNFNDNNRILVVAGNILKKYKKNPISNKNIIFIDHTDKIFHYFRASDFFVSASYLEGLPNAVLESLLMGTPCVLSDIPMHLEIIEGSKHLLGLTFKNNNENDLIDKMMQIESSVNDQTPIYCTKHILENFSALRMTKQYEDLYLSIN